MNHIRHYAVVVLMLYAGLAGACNRNKTKDYWEEGKDPSSEKVDPTLKPRYIWIDANANFPDFANSQEAIRRDVRKAKEVGFTDIVVDVRPNSGDVLFKTSVGSPLTYAYAWHNGSYSRLDRTATFDYLQTFIEVGHAEGLRVHASINTFVGGSVAGGGSGMVYRDPEKAKWCTRLNTSTGIRSAMDTSEPEKFLNPALPEVQEYICGLLRDLARYPLDGIFLDRARYNNLMGDFSDYSRKQFEEYLGGVTIANFPEDILPVGAVSLPSTPPKYLKKWLEFRAKTIYDFMVKAREAVKGVNPKIKFGVYVGGWYSQYYDVGVNWASTSYDPSREFDWVSPDYHKYGYADLMDHMLIGAYAHPHDVYGDKEWTMQGFCKLAMDKIKGKCPIVCGGPDVGNWDPKDTATPVEEEKAMVESVSACMSACDGYFLFDMIHLKAMDRWEFVKQGIEKALR